MTVSCKRTLTFADENPAQNFYHISSRYIDSLSRVHLCVPFSPTTATAVLNGRIFVVNRERDDLNASKYPLLIWRFKLSGW